MLSVGKDMEQQSLSQRAGVRIGIAVLGINLSKDSKIEYLHLYTLEV